MYQMKFTANAADTLCVRNLRTSFFTREGVVKAVDDVSISIHQGESLGLVGESGCGKSMTAFSIMGLVPNPPGKIIGGEVLFGGRDLLKMSKQELREIRGCEISMIFQEPMTSMNPAYTIGNQVREVIRIHSGIERKLVQQKALEILASVQIPDPEWVLSQYPHQLSGGMLQRVMIAMGLSCQPKLLICDEPTTALDVSSQAQIIDLLNLLKKEKGASLLFITHDLGVLGWVCNKAAVMYAGNIVEYSDIRTILLTPRHPYTIALIGSTPRLDQDTDALKVIRGQVPNLINPPSGCKFHPRCHLTEEGCRSESPPLVEKMKGHWVACHLA